MTSKMEDDKRDVRALPEGLLPPHTAPLVKRIPVKLNRKMKNLNIVQFPMNEKPLTGNLKVDYKKENKKIKIYADMDKREVVFNKNVDMQKLEFDSQMIGRNTNYFIGVIQDDELHLNEVDSLHQMRVNLNNLAKKSTEDVEDIPEEEVETKKQPVSYKFIGVQAQGGDKQPQSAIQSIIRKEQDEDYLGYGWREYNSNQSNEEFLQRLMSSSTNEILAKRLELLNYLYNLLESDYNKPFYNDSKQSRKRSQFLSNWSIDRLVKDPTPVSLYNRSSNSQSSYSHSLTPLPTQLHPDKKRKRRSSLYKIQALYQYQPLFKHLQSTKSISQNDWNLAKNEIKYNKVINKIDSLQNSDVGWSFKQPKKHKGVPINYSHWDHLLEHVTWLQSDYKSERMLKLSIAALLAKECQKWHTLSPSDRKSITVSSYIPQSTAMDLDEKPVQQSRQPLLEPTINPVVDLEKLSNGHLNDLSQFFPDLPSYDIKSATQETRYDPSSSQSSKLTPVNRLMDYKLTLVSSLEPGKHRVQNEWDLDSFDNQTSTLQNVFDEPYNPLSGSSSAPTLSDLFSGKKPKSDKDKLNNPPSGVPSTSLHWSGEDDGLLTMLVKQYGYSWNFIADVFNGSTSYGSHRPPDKRSPIDCHQRWKQKTGGASADTPAASTPSAQERERNEKSKKDTKKKLNLSEQPRRALRRSQLVGIIGKSSKKREKDTSKRESQQKRVSLFAHETHSTDVSKLQTDPIALSTLKAERDRQVQAEFFRRQQALAYRQAQQYLMKGGNPKMLPPNHPVAIAAAAVAQGKGPGSPGAQQQATFAQSPQLQQAALMGANNAQLPPQLQQQVRMQQQAMMRQPNQQGQQPARPPNGLPNGMSVQNLQQLASLPGFANGTGNPEQLRQLLAQANMQNNSNN
ncbi:hypothetical protein WALSEDRAFT_69534 [Wallemia mellicola CBS 633.66]|uniref:Vacuolar import and degradation protein 21 n=1 Tax=Wallemia mellicola (strain ATCC MYA-4683 / CBS 633.66) TaxID=671144 RepID=I4YA73_WALMC|nr:hypothetical protein WALSEDRAFT_69534 [Wallemia mellicola CBS 633.66]EIM20865.1 hypothetical protein WALSEDRAFT_69534 [Wallemia mellicola CBS 633.66]|eukprot:XP_006959126.1 hypothetical protein WALSEDRAFT_69534 [Wallemia mellicola CBS 633.66]